jgi:predicted ATPase
LAYALGCAALFYLLRREGQLAQERAEEVITLATEQGFPYWLASGTRVRGWALADQGQVQKGIQMHQSSAPYQLGQLAETYGKVGQVEEGLSLLARALAQVEKTGERVYEAELYRIKGELLLMQESKKQKSKGKSQKSENTEPRPLIPDPQGEAEACLLKAIEISRKQQAKSLELRAATSLARLWQQQGKQAAAHKLLSEIYNWFTEGFDTKDLQEAKVLLDSLESRA